MIYEYSFQINGKHILHTQETVFLHYRKLIDKDIFDVYSVTDEFVNKKEKLNIKKRVHKSQIF